MSGYQADFGKLDTPWRREALPPVQVLDALGLRPEDDVADIGCGIGYFAIPAAKRLAPGHRLYAVDPSAGMLEELNRRAAGEGVLPLTTVLSEPLDFKLPDQSVDFVLLANVFHEIEDKAPFLQETKRIIRTGGRLGLVEWLAVEAPYGPPLWHRISEGETDGWFEKAGFLLDRRQIFGAHFYGRVYRLP